MHRNECALVLLKDNKTLFAVMRVDAGDGQPHGYTKPLWAATSSDGGGTWSAAAPLPPDMLSAQPRAVVLGNGALLVTAGRPGVDLFLSVDGFGHAWKRYSLPTFHNGAPNLLHTSSPPFTTVCPITFNCLHTNMYLLWNCRP